MQVKIFEGLQVIGVVTIRPEYTLPLNGDIIHLPVSKEQPQIFKKYEIINRLFVFTIGAGLADISLVVKEIFV